MPATLTTRTAKGAPLSWSEMDGNFTSINASLIAAEMVINDLFTDGGEGGFWPDVSATATVYRLRDRLFIGEGAEVTGNSTGTQGSILPTATEGANWALRDSQALSIASTGLIAISGVSRSNDQNATPTECIGIAGFVINNKASGKAWGVYSDLQHESGATASYGLEVAAKNKAANSTAGSYGLGTDGVFGVWLAAGGDGTYGGSPVNPSNTAMVILSNDSTWNKGIVFSADSLTGCDGTTGTGVAVEMAKGHRILWKQASGFSGAEIRSDVSIGGREVSMVFDNRLIGFFGESGQNLFRLSHTASAANYLQIASQIANSPPEVQCAGSDTNIDLYLKTKGSGVLKFGTHEAVTTETVTGYITIKDAAGNSRKLAVVS